MMTTDKMPVLEYTRIYADADGNSHFAKDSFPLTERIEGAGVLDTATSALPIKRVWFRRVSENDAIGTPHCAPRRQFVMHLSGAVEIEVSDGTKQVFGPNEIVLAEDTHGEGHITRGVGELPRVMVVLEIAE